MKTFLFFHLHNTFQGQILLLFMSSKQQQHVVQISQRIIKRDTVVNRRCCSLIFADTSFIFYVAPGFQELHSRAGSKEYFLNPPLMQKNILVAFF